MIRDDDRHRRRTHQRAAQRIVILHVHDVRFEIAQQPLRRASRTQRNVHVAIKRRERKRAHLHDAHAFGERQRLRRNGDGDLVAGGSESAREIAREYARPVARTERLAREQDPQSDSASASGAASPKCRSRHANATPATSGSQKFTPRKIIVAVIAFCFAMPRDVKTSVMTPSTTATPCGIGLTMKKTIPIPNAATSPPSGTSMPNA